MSSLPTGIRSTSHGDNFGRLLEVFTLRDENLPGKDELMVVSPGDEEMNAERLRDDLAGKNWRRVLTDTSLFERACSQMLGLTPTGLGYLLPAFLVALNRPLERQHDQLSRNLVLLLSEGLSESGSTAAKLCASLSRDQREEVVSRLKDLASKPGGDGGLKESEEYTGRIQRIVEAYERSNQDGKS